MERIFQVRSAFGNFALRRSFRWGDGSCNNASRIPFVMVDFHPKTHLMTGNSNLHKAHLLCIATAYLLISIPCLFVHVCVSMWVCFAQIHCFLPLEKIPCVARVRSIVILRRECLLAVCVCVCNFGCISKCIVYAFIVYTVHCARGVSMIVSYVCKFIYNIVAMLSSWTDRLHSYCNVGAMSVHCLRNRPRLHGSSTLLLPRQGVTLIWLAWCQTNRHFVRSVGVLLPFQVHARSPLSSSSSVSVGFLVALMSAAEYIVYRVQY